MFILKSVPGQTDKFAYTQLHWDKADRAAYYLNTGWYLQPCVSVIQNITNECEAAGFQLMKLLVASNRCIC